jgi:polyhydroxybutyrate depolymerase
VKFVIPLTLLIFCSGCDSGNPADLQPGEFDYSHLPDNSKSCRRESRQGETGITNNIEGASGDHYNVRTPVNYDSAYAHPLVMVFAPAGTSRYGSERLVRLTRHATEKGYIIAYADSHRLSPESADILAQIPGKIAARWCIDRKRVFLTGHSDGGTMSHAISFLAGSRGVAAAIAPSAAGIRQEDLRNYSCPDTMPVMVMHNSQDQLFPNWGTSAANWWAACNGCNTESTHENVYGCAEYDACTVGARTMYCERPGKHIDWPGMNSEILDFFSNHSIATFDNAVP